LPPGGDTYADRILEKLSSQLEEAMKRPAAEPDVVKKMQEDIKMLVEANAKLQAQLAVRAKP